MTDFSTLLQQGNAWLFIPSAILLGALHGLEPGHSKTMMAAFIVAVRGTLGQAVLLGLAATLSHTAVVWAVAMGGMYFGQNWGDEASEPYFQLISAVLMIAVAAWMLWRLRRQQSACFHDHGSDESHSQDHGHDHGAPHAAASHDASHLIDSGHGVLRLEIFEVGMPPRFRLYPQSAGGHVWPAKQVRVETERGDGARQSFEMMQRAGFLESAQTIPEPHQFVASLHLGTAGHSHHFDVEFVEPAHHADHGHGHKHEHEHEHDQAEPHAHAIKDYERLDVAAPGYQDPHELAHANDIRRRFGNREVTTGQIVVFGLTGGLIPCPASITVLLLCLQLKKIALGATLVMSFSVGLALTMVASGVLAALSLKHVSKRWSGFGEFARRAPYFSGLLILGVGLYIAYGSLLKLI
ncbi:nickel/cobalt efflux transporter [Roseateles sp. GG27B]